MSHDEIVKEKMKQYTMGGGWGNTSGNRENEKKRNCVHIIAVGDIMTGLGSMRTRPSMSARGCNNTH
jgi:hypothetical protein